MKILFDHGVPVPLRKFLQPHIVETAFEKDWQTLKNGDLLKNAELDAFDFFITTDQNLQYQQTLANRKIAVIVLNTTSWPRIKTQAINVVQAVSRAEKNSFEEISFKTKDS